MSRGEGAVTMELAMIVGEGLRGREFGRKERGREMDGGSEDQSTPKGELGGYLLPCRVGEG